MKLYDIYLIRQAKYSEYILLIESGMFIETYGKDAKLASFNLLLYLLNHILMLHLDP